MYLRVIAVHGFDQFYFSTFLEMFNFVIETYLVGNSLICELLFMKRSTFLGGGGGKLSEFNNRGIGQCD